MEDRFYVYEAEDSERIIATVSRERLTEAQQERAREYGVWGAWREADGKVAIAFENQYDTQETNLVVSPDGYVFN